MALHYGQAIFEGIKAYRNQNGEAFIFAPTIISDGLIFRLTRMQMPAVPEEFLLKACAS